MLQSRSARRSLFAALAAMSLCVESGAFLWRKEMKADFYVSPSGNDTWSGTCAAASRDGTDGPFATVARARDAVRELKASAPGTQAITVAIREGIYRVSEPVLFTPEDSGTADAPIIYRTYPGERAAISGGRVIEGWQDTGTGVWKAFIPEVARGEWGFSQLFAGGSRRPRCRMPNEGYFRIEGPLAPKPARKSKEWGDSLCRLGFFYKPEDVQDWPDFRDMNVFLFHSWTTSVHWVESINAADHSLHFTAGSGWPVGYWEKDARYYVENIRAALDLPGEWYLNGTEGMLYYIPLPGERIEDFRPVAPLAKQLVRLEGDPDAGLYVEHIHFRGLAFEHTAWDLPRNKRHDGQAAVDLSAAVYTRGANHCCFEEIEIAHVGSYGLWFAKGSRNNVLIQSELRDLAGGGVKIGETEVEANPATACQGNLVENCYIHDGGHIARAGIGVWVGRSSYNRIRHNEICDFDYSAVSLGWSWGYAPSTANHNVVEYNYMHHIGNGVLSDMGGIYCLGISPGTLLRGNVMHDIFSYSYGGWGLYTDEGSSDILMENNIVYNTKSGGFHQHYGRENIVRSNLFAFSREGQIIRSRQEDHISFTLEKNVVVFDNGQPLGGNWSNGNFRLNNNLYWDITGQSFTFSGLELDEWREEGQDLDSVITDPLFRDAAGYDFRLRRSSPVPNYGIDPEAIIAKAGLYGSSEWRRRPKNAVHRTIDPSMREPKSTRPAAPLRKISEDFENLAVGDPASFASTSGEDSGASIRVSDEIACTGKHSLKFTDAAGLAYEWQPHLATHMAWLKGVVRGSFDVYLKPGAIFWHEWRNSDSPYKIGPSIRLTGGGKLEVTARDTTGKETRRSLMDVPAEVWIHVELECPLGSPAAKDYRLSLRLPGTEPQGFSVEKGNGEAWDRCTTMVFVSEATTATEFYLDNVSFERMKE